jgi:hypothetical protein
MHLKSFVLTSTCILFCLLANSSVMAKKHAFVVGINEYTHLSSGNQLVNSVNDAKAISKEFKRLGYTVTYKQNLSRSDFNRLWQDFLERLMPGDTVALFFSGYGIRISHGNYLIPKDIPFIKWGRREQLKRESIYLDALFEDLQQKELQVTLIILGIERGNPFIPVGYRKNFSKSVLRSYSGGEGMYFLYSSSGGQISLDSLGSQDSVKHSLFVRKLLPLMRTPNLPINHLARKLRLDVFQSAKSTGHRQIPIALDGLTQEFCLGGCKSERPGANQYGEKLWGKNLRDLGTMENKTVDTPYGKINCWKRSGSDSYKPLCNWVE